MGAACVYGIGRIGRRRTRVHDDPERREAYYDRYLPIDPIKLSELGDPTDERPRRSFMLQAPGSTRSVTGYSQIMHFTAFCMKNPLLPYRHNLGGLPRVDVELV